MLRTFRNIITGSDKEISPIFMTTRSPVLISNESSPVISVRNLSDFDSESVIFSPPTSCLTNRLSGTQSCDSVTSTISCEEITVAYGASQLDENLRFGQTVEGPDNFVAITTEESASNIQNLKRTGTNCNGNVILSPVDGRCLSGDIVVKEIIVDKDRVVDDVKNVLEERREILHGIVSIMSPVDELKPRECRSPINDKMHKRDTQNGIEEYSSDPVQESTVPW